jgi:membrane-associated HD superfamily phosphohydrolase
MSKLNFFISGIILIITVCAFSIAPKSGTTQQSLDSTKKQNSNVSVDTSNTIQNIPQDNAQNNLQIDTALNTSPQQTIVPDTLTKIDSALIEDVSENTLTNTKLSIYILLSVLGLALFYYIFVITLFKTFHKKKSTRQSLLLSWNLFFIVTIIWIFIIWGLVAGFWAAASFMIVVIFLFIISLIMTIIAIKSK